MDTPRTQSYSTPLSLRSILLLFPDVQVMLPLISMAPLCLTCILPLVSFMVVYGRCMSRQMAGIYVLMFCMTRAN
jgi:hypothetical protein